MQIFSPLLYQLSYLAGSGLLDQLRSCVFALREASTPNVTSAPGLAHGRSPFDSLGLTVSHWMH